MRIFSILWLCFASVSLSAQTDACMTGSPVDLSGCLSGETTVGATASGAFTAPNSASCDVGQTFTIDRWYEVTAPATNGNDLEITFTDVNDNHQVVVLEVPNCADPTSFVELGCYEAADLSGGTSVSLQNCFEANQTYHIVVLVEPGNEGAYDICATFSGGTIDPTVPGHDCANPLVLALADTDGTDNSCSVSVSTGDLTNSQMEAKKDNITAPGCIEGDAATFWISFTAGDDLYVSNLGSAGLSAALYSGACGSLALVDCSTDITTLEDQLTIGDTYFLQIAYTNGNDANFDICINSPQPPTEDDCNTPIVLTDGSTATGDNVGSTSIGGEYNSGCFGGIGYSTVYYEYTVNAGATNIDIDFTAGTTGADASVSILQTCSSTTEEFVQCGYGSDQICLDPGTYLVQVATNDGSEGTFDLTMTANTNPTNDLCSGAVPEAIASDCVPVTLSQPNTTEFSCPESTNWGSSCAFDSEGTVYLSFTTDADAQFAEVQLTPGTITSPMFALLEGACGSLNLVDDCTSATGTPVMFTVNPNSTYYIAIASNGGTDGTFDVQVEVTNPPANDQCTDADGDDVLTLGTPISGTTVCATGNNDVLNSCVSSPDQTGVWYTYDVTSTSKTLTVDVTGLTSGGEVNIIALESCGSPIYYNNDPNNEACGNTDAQMTIDCPENGTTIFIQVSTTEADWGDFDIVINETQTVDVVYDDCTTPELIVPPLCEESQFGPYNNSTACPEDFTIGSCDFDTEETIFLAVDLPVDATDIDLGINSYAGTANFAVLSDCTGSSLDGVCHSAVSGGDFTLTDNIDVSAFAGTQILIAISTLGDDGGDITMDIKINNTPVNDDPCDAEIASVGINSGTTFCATEDFADPNCPASQYEATVWYTYDLQPGETGIEVTTTNTGVGGPFGVMLVDFTSGCTNVPTLFNDAFSCDAENEVVKVTCLMSPQTIHIAVATSSLTAGTFDLDIQPIIPDPTCVDNEECSMAEDLGQYETDLDCVPIADCNENACPDVIGNCNGGLPVNNVVWYQVRNDGDGEFISVDITNADFDSPVVAIFKGGDCNSLVQIGGCTTGAGGTAATGPIEIDDSGAPPVLDETYWIAIGTDGPDGGNFEYCINITAGCVNDLCENAVDLPDDTPVSNPFNSNGCTPDYDNEVCPDQTTNTIWFKYTVPPGTARIDIVIRDVDGDLGDYSVQIDEYNVAECPPTGVALVSDCDNSGTYINNICVKENTEYFIQIGTADPLAPNDAEITVSAVDPIVPNDLCSAAQNDAAFQFDVTPAEYCQFVELTGTTVDACPDDFQNGACDYTESGTVWYLINVPNDPVIGTMDVVVENNGLDMPIFSILDNDCTNFTPIAGGGCSMPNGPDAELLNIAVNPGDVYLVPVASGNMTDGDFTIKVKFYAPPSNDECTDPIIVAAGSSVPGTTECATNNPANPLQTCTATAESDVWFEIPVDGSFDAYTVEITGWTGSGNWAAELFWGNGGCNYGMIAPPPELPTSDCTNSSDKCFKVSTVCNPGVTALTLQVGSLSADSETGQFTVTVTGHNPSCSRADECDEITTAELLEPVTSSDPTQASTPVCLQSCIEYACGDAPSGCPADPGGGTVYFQVNTDAGAGKLIANVTTNGWDPDITIYTGGNIADPLDCGALALGPDGACMMGSGGGVLNNNVSVSGSTVYVIAVTYGGPGSLTPTCDHQDLTFDLCVRTEPFYAECTQDQVATVVFRSNDPDGSLGLDLEGPYCPGEQIRLCYTFTFDNTQTSCQWFHGFVPTFGDGWDLDAIDPASIVPTGGAFEWFDEGTYNYQAANPFLCTAVNPETGLLEIHHIDESPIPCTPGIQNVPMPGGWYINGGDGTGAGCAGSGNPNVEWGDPMGCGSTKDYEICFDLQVKQFTSIAECNEADLSLGLYPFADGETGCWTDSRCAGDLFIKKNYAIACDGLAEVTTDPEEVNICKEGDYFINISSNPSFGVTIEWTATESVPGLIQSGTLSGTGNVINEDVVNNTLVEQTVTYEIFATNEDGCPGPIKELVVTIYPELQVNFDDEPYYVCEGTCRDLMASSILGGSGNYISYNWQPTGETTETINICPTVPTTYILTVEDDNGCTGSGEVEVTISPAILADLAPEYYFCKDGIEGNSEPIVAEIIQGSFPVTGEWTLVSGDLDGFQDIELFGFDKYSVFEESSSVTFFDPNVLCAVFTDNFGCTVEVCTDVYVLDAPIGILELSQPLQCNQEIVDLIASFDNNSSGFFQMFELWSCDGTILYGESFSNLTTFSDLDLGQNNCFELRTFDIEGCTNQVQLTITPTSGVPIELTPADTICNGSSKILEVINTADYTNPTYEWSTNDTNPAITVSPTTTTTYSVTVTDESGCSDVVTVEIVVKDNPIINISGSTSYCAGSSTTLEATQNNISDIDTIIYSWRLLPALTEVSNTATVTVSTPGDYQIEMIVNGCASLDTVSVIEDSELAVNINDLALCDNAEDTLRAGNGFETYEWYFNGDLQPSETTSKYAVSQAGEYVVIVTDGDCSGRDTVVVINNPTPVVSVTDTVFVCRENNGIDSVYVDFNGQVTGATGTWQDLNGSSVSLADLDSVSFEGIARDTYNFRYTTNTAISPCSNVSVNMAVIVKNCPCPLVATLNLPEQCNSEGNVLDLNDYLNNPAIQIGSWSFVSGPENVVITNDEFNTGGIAPGQYTLQWTIANPVGTCPTSSQETILVFDEPEINLDQNPSILCNAASGNGEVSLNLNTLVLAGSDNGEWSQVDGPTVTIPNVDATGLTQGDVLTFRYTTNTASGPCTDQSEDITVTVVDCNCPIVTIDALPGLCNDGTAIDLNNFLNSTESGTWSSTSGSITGSSFDPEDLLSGAYTVTFTLDNDPGGDCPVAFDAEIIISRAPQAVVAASGSPCNEDTGAGPTTVNLFQLLEPGYSAGTWMQTSGTTLTIEADGTVDFAGLPVGTVIDFEYTTTSAIAPCQNITVPATVTVSDCECPNVNINSPADICNDEISLDLTGLEDPNIDEGSWSVTDPSGADVSITGSSLNVNGIMPGDYQLTYTLTNPAGGTCPPSNVVTLSVFENKEATVQMNVDVCTEDKGNGENVLDFSNFIIDGFTGGTWVNTDNAPVDFTNVFNVDFSAATIDDSYTFTYRIDNDSPCGDNAYTITVNVIDCLCPPINPMTIPDQCTESFTLNLSQFNDPDRPGTWSNNEGLIINGDVLDLSAATAGNYTLVYTDPSQDPGCPDTKDVLITIIAPANTGMPLDTTLCFGSDDVINLASLLSGEDPAGRWREVSIQPTTGDGFDAGSGQFRAADQSVNTYTFEYFFNNQSPCPESSSRVNVTIENVPVADAGEAQTIDCTNSMAELGGTSSEGPDITYLWTHDGGSTINGDDQRQISVNFGGVFTLLVTNTATGCTAEDVVTITVDPNIPQAELRFDNVSCFGESDGRISFFNVTGGAAPLRYSLDNGTTFQNSPDFTNLGPGEYRMLIVDAIGCIFTDIVTITEPSQLTLDIGPNATVELNEDFTLNISDLVNPESLTDIVWTVTDSEGQTTVCSGLDCLERSFVNVDDRLEICVEIFAGDCSASDCMIVNLFKIKDLELPNIITPGSNNVNSTFTVNSTDVETVNYIRIFDRWGNKVFDVENVPADGSIGWDGTLNGKPVEIGVYVYTVEVVFKNFNLDGEEVDEVQLFTGDITVIDKE